MMGEVESLIKHTCPCHDKLLFILKSDQTSKNIFQKLRKSHKQQRNQNAHTHKYALSANNIIGFINYTSILKSKFHLALYFRRSLARKINMQLKSYSESMLKKYTYTPTLLKIKHR